MVYVESLIGDVECFLKQHGTHRGVFLDFMKLYNTSPDAIKTYIIGRIKHLEEMDEMKRTGELPGLIESYVIRHHTEGGLTGIEVHNQEYPLPTCGCMG